MLTIQQSSNNSTIFKQFNRLQAGTSVKILNASNSRLQRRFTPIYGIVHLEEYMSSTKGKNSLPLE
ncbi:MAG TPA: hypothetical protein V6C96_02125, partial [Vampirovibrionales bacterium]